MVDGAVEGIRLAVRGRLQQPVASQCAVRVLNKQFQQVELAGGEFVFVAVGEEASKLDTMLLHLADLSAKETQRSIDRAMTLVSPVLTIGIGALIGGLFVSIVRALLSVNDLVLG